MKESTPSVSAWSVIGLLISAATSLFLLTTCFSYYAILRQGWILASRVDSRGGLWEINSLVPLLIGVAVLCGLASGKRKPLRRLVIYLAVGQIVSGVLCYVLAHYIRTSLR